MGAYVLLFTPNIQVLRACHGARINRKTMPPLLPCSCLFVP
jgi:hypothetical protein